MKHHSQCVYVNGELYILSGLDDEYKCKSSIIEYSSSKNKWETIAASMYDGRRFSKSCSFLDNVYIIGGTITPHTDYLVLSSTQKVKPGEKFPKWPSHVIVLHAKFSKKNLSFPVDTVM